MSTTSQLSPLFGRKWQVQIQLPGGTLFTIPDPASDPVYDPQALRIMFDIRTVAFAQFWSADIIIINPDNELIDPILNAASQGAIVTVAAGYQNGNYGTIWSAPLFQSFLERENVTDLKLTLYCILRLPPLSQAVAGATIAAFQTQQQIIQQIAAIAGVKTGYISPNLKANPRPRAQTIFGSMSRQMDDIANFNNMQWWLDSKGLNIGNIADDLQSGSGISAGAPLFVFSPPSIPGTAGPRQNPSGTGSIIGTPQQTMYGVDFRVLLDPRVVIQKPLIKVKIDNTLIQFLKGIYGQNLRLLDQNGEYVVIAARYVGDTRGNSWYTDITGVTVSANYLASIVASSSWSSGSPSN